MKHALGIDIGSTTVKVTVINESHDILFSDYKRHFANIKGTLQTLLSEAREKLGNLTIHPTVTGSGGMANLRILTYSILSGSSLCGECLTGL